MPRHKTRLKRSVHTSELSVRSSAHATRALPKEITRALQGMFPDLRALHKEACKCICAVNMTVRRLDATVLVPTQINVYFVWIAWVRAMCCTNLDPADPKRAHMQYYKQMTLEKIMVLIPTVCFWVCQKCMEPWSVRSNDVVRVIIALQIARNIDRFECTVQDVVNAEHAILEMLDFDILKHQKDVDRIEDILREKFEDLDSMDVITQTEVARSVYHMFHDI